MNVAGKVLLVFLEAGLNKVLEYKEISLDLSMAATGGEPERQGDHFGSESVVDSSRRAEPGGREGRRCSR